MSTRRSAVDVTYDEPPTRERARERRVQEVPCEEIDNIRNQELAIVRSGDREREQSRRREYKPDNQLVVPPRYPDDEDYGPPARRSLDSRRYGRSAREDYRDVVKYKDELEEDEDDSDSDYERRRRRHHKHRRAHSDSRDKRDKNDKNDKNDNNRGAPAQGGEEDKGNLLWYSMKKRQDGNFVERNFDPSYDGILAAAAGAALGAMTARRFGGEMNSKLKMLGGGLAGAMAFNASENQYKIFLEEKTGKKEDRWEQKWGPEKTAAAGKKYGKDDGKDQ